MGPQSKRYLPVNILRWEECFMNCINWGQENGRFFVKSKIINSQRLFFLKYVPQFMLMSSHSNVIPWKFNLKVTVWLFCKDILQIYLKSQKVNHSHTFELNSTFYTKVQSKMLKTS